MGRSISRPQPAPKRSCDTESACEARQKRLQTLTTRTGNWPSLRSNGCLERPCRRLRRDQANAHLAASGWFWSRAFLTSHSKCDMGPWQDWELVPLPKIGMLSRPTLGCTLKGDLQRPVHGCRVHTSLDPPSCLSIMAHSNEQISECLVSTF